MNAHVAKLEARLAAGGWKGTPRLPGEPITAPQIQAGLIKSHCRGYPKISNALPKFCGGAEHVKDGRNAGKPIITSHTHEKELCRRYGFTPARQLDLPPERK